MGTLAISENSDKMLYYAAFHQGLDCLFEIISRVLICDASVYIFFDFSLTVKAAPYECVIRTGQP